IVLRLHGLFRFFGLLRAGHQRLAFDLDTVRDVEHLVEMIVIQSGRRRREDDHDRIVARGLAALDVVDELRLLAILAAIDKGEDTPGVTIARTLDRVTLGILSRLPVLDGWILRTVIGALTLEAGLSVRTVGIPRPDRQGAQLAAQHQAIAALV